MTAVRALCLAAGKVLQHVRTNPRSSRQPLTCCLTAAACTHGTVQNCSFPRGRPRLRNLVVPAATASSVPPGGSHDRNKQQLPPYSSWPITAKMALRTGLYISILGLAVLLLPTAVFGAVFDTSVVTPGWIRVGGVLASLYGFYYVGAALDDAAGQHPRHFYTSTIAGRLLLSASFTVLVALGQCEQGLLWLAAANAASSLLLWRAVQQRQRLPPV